MTPAIKLTASFESDVGLIRTHNDDFGLVYLSPTRQPTARALLMVADSWSGHMADQDKEAGRMASEFVLTTIFEELHDFLDQPTPGSENSATRLVNQLHEAIAIANQELCRLDGRWGMVDGLACVLIQDNLAAMVNHASARIYLLRNTVLRLITDNFPWGYNAGDAKHAYGALLGENTAIQLNYWQGPNRDDAEFGRRANSTVAVQLNVWTESLQANDRLLVCTDGLWGLVEEINIANSLSDADSPRVAVQRLVAAANAQRGADNVTVIVCDVLAQ